MQLEKLNFPSIERESCQQHKKPRAPAGGLTESPVMMSDQKKNSLSSPGGTVKGESHCKTAPGQGSALIPSRPEIRILHPAWLGGTSEGNPPH